MMAGPPICATRPWASPEACSPAHLAGTLLVCSSVLQLVHLLSQPLRLPGQLPNLGLRSWQLLCPARCMPNLHIHRQCRLHA